MKELSSIKVTYSDPYLSAEKWNASIDFTDSFERIISSMLGKSFKGIYRPNRVYEAGDYVWSDGKFYVINGAGYRSVSTLEARSYTKAFYSNSSYVALNENGKIVRLNSGFEKEISGTFCDDIYVGGGEDFAIVTNESRVYRIDLATGRRIELNIQLEEDIEKILCDSFAVYTIKNNSVYKSENLSPESTYFEEVMHSEKRIIDAEVTEKYFIILFADRTMAVYDKFFKIITTIDAGPYITDIEKAKIATCENETIAVFCGSNSVSFFFVDKNNNVEYSDTFSNESFSSARSMTSSEGKVVLTDDFGISSFDIGRYNKTEVDVRDLIINSGAAPTDKLSFAVSYKNGNISSAAGARKTPDSNTSTSIIPGKGITGGTIKYSGIDFLNKTIVVEGIYSGSQESHEIGYITGAGKKVPLILNNPKQGRFKLIITTDSYMNGTSNLFQDLMSTYQNTSTNSSEQGVLSLSLSSATVSAVYAVNEIIDDSKQYMLSKTELYIPATYEKNAYPNAPAVADENGVVNLKRKNNSIAVDSNGYFVSTSDRTDLADSFTVASSLAIKTVMDQLYDLQMSAGAGLTPLGNAQSKYNTAEKIGNEIDSVSTLLATMLPKGNVDSKYDTAEKIAAALIELLSRPTCPHRVGDYLHTENGTSPAASWPGTKWERIYDKFLMGTSAVEAAGTEGGSREVKLTISMIPSHSHTIPSHSHTIPSHTHSLDLGSGNGGGRNYIAREVDRYDGSFTNNSLGNPYIKPSGGGTTSSLSLSTNSSGSGTPFSILPPYRKVHIWKRIG